MGFREHPKEDYEFEVGKTYGGGYCVSLPHQCNDWKVLGWEKERDTSPSEVAHEGWYPAHPTDKEFAVKQMELFVQRAKEALERLKAL